jgi:5,10-methenyltetrahydrofolate synthetase
MEIPSDLGRWRKDQRSMLLARRLAAPAVERARWNNAVTACLEQGFSLLRQMVVGYCWPYKGEFDARPLIRRLVRDGARVALPSVVEKGQPLQFREWRPGVAMRPGVFDLPVPYATSVLLPDALLIPPVGFGEHGGRLGYGGGYFDRTLAALSPQPLKIGVGFELSRIPTIHPQPHDVLMDFIVTEAGIHAVESDGMRLVGALDCAQRAARIAAERGLPRRQPFGSADPMP